MCLFLEGPSLCQLIFVFIFAVFLDWGVSEDDPLRNRVETSPTHLIYCTSIIQVFVTHKLNGPALAVHS